jgi:hypothetical protein
MCLRELEFLAASRGKLPMERQITTAPHGHVLTNTGVWSPEGQWIVYDVRSDAAGTLFDGARIEKTHVETGEVRVLYEARHGAKCGVATWSPTEATVAFILGPENPWAEWSYGAARRQGVVVHDALPAVCRNLDARELTEPFKAGALRGGSHVHVFSGDGVWVSFTYHDHILEQLGTANEPHDIDQRNVGVCVPAGRVDVSRRHPRNHHGEMFSVLVTRTVASPKTGSDEIMRAFEEGWVGGDGYVRSDGSRQTKAIAFQGEVAATDGTTHMEVFIVDLPEDLTVAGDRQLEGTSRLRPAPPRGVVQRRLTWTDDRTYPGICGPRHWLRSSPSGDRIAFLMRDDEARAQLWTVSPNGGEPLQITRNPYPVSSAFSWSPDGQLIAHIMDECVCVTNIATGLTQRVTTRSSQWGPPRPEACVFSPDGASIAFVRRVRTDDQEYNQVFVAAL